MFGVWNLWIQRNRKAFKQQAPNPNLVKVVEMQAQEFLYCVVEPSIEKARHVKQVRWLKPIEGWLKWNSDGLVISTSGLSGCGGLIRDSAGQWVIGFVKSINVNSSIAAKLWALREGLILCIECEAHVVGIELDAFAAISLVARNVNLMEIYLVLLMIAGNCCCSYLKLSYLIALGRQISMPML